MLHGPARAHGEEDEEEEELNKLHICFLKYLFFTHTETKNDSYFISYFHFLTFWQTHSSPFLTPSPVCAEHA